MAQTLCIKCGSELTPSSYCELCKEPLIFACTSCNYITEEKVHADCRNATELTKTTDATITTAEGGEAAASIQTPTSSTRRNEEKIDRRIEPEITIVEPKPQPASCQSTGEENNNNPFVLSTTQRLWQSLVGNWYNAYGEFLKNATSMTENWYNTYWKPWLKPGQWQQMQKQQKDRDKVNVEE